MRCAMNCTMLLLALIHFLSGRQSLAAAPPIYPDIIDPTCVLGEGCVAGMMPRLRGLCVAVNNTKWCWDACNLAHQPLSYSSNATTAAGMALLVQQVRTNINSASPCPGIQTVAGCNVGQRCTPPYLTLDRGMCVLDGSNGNKCMDMCDTNIPLSTFKSAPGKQAGTTRTVELVRSGHDPMGKTTCPGPSVWIWLWIPILLCLCIACCGIAYYMYQFYRKRLLKHTKRDVDIENDSPFIDQPPPQQDFVQDFPPGYQQVENKEMPLDYQGDYPPTADRDMLPPYPEVQDQPPVMEPQPMMEPAAPPAAPPAPAPAPLVEPIQPVTAFNDQSLFGTPSLIQQQAAAPSTFYTSQPAVQYPAAYSYQAPAATATSYTIPMQQYGQYTAQQPTTAYYAQQPSASYRIG